MQEEWVICRILHKAGDQYSKLMMLKNPYYLPMGVDPSSFCFQQDHAAAPLPSPSGCTSVGGVPFHHGHPGMQLPLLPSSQGKISGVGGCGFPASASMQEPAAHGCSGGGSSNAMGMPPYPHPFASVAGGGNKPAPPPPSQVGVNAAGPQEPPPPPPPPPASWLEAAYVQHGGFLYEMGPGAAPLRGA